MTGWLVLAMADTSPAVVWTVVGGLFGLFALGFKAMLAQNKEFSEKAFEAAAIADRATTALALNNTALDKNTQELAEMRRLVDVIQRHDQEWERRIREETRVQAFAEWDALHRGPTP